jgi:hypothetical protein
MKRVLSLVVLLVGFAVLNSCGGSDTQTPMPNPDPNNPPAVITLTFSAPSSSNYILEKVEGASNVGMAGMANAEITLEVGKRYRIVNQALGAHPFAFSSSTTYTTASGTLLLTESGAGSFATNTGVNYVKNSDGFTFTLTSELAAQLKSYLCTFHSPMLGVVKVTGR